MINVESIFRQRIADIQSRIPVKLSIMEDISYGEGNEVSGFQAALNAASGDGLTAGQFRNQVQPSSFGSGADAGYRNILESANSFVGMDNQGLWFSYGRDEEWCADFISYLFSMDESLKNKLPNSSRVQDFYNYFNNNNSLYSQPKVGDIAIFNENRHIGIVYSVDGNNVTIIEGNTGNNDNRLSKVNKYTYTMEQVKNKNIQFGRYASSGVSSDMAYIESVINDACRQYNVSPDIIKSIIMAESSFNPNAVSGSGAQGLMQLMPATAKGMGVTNPFDILENVYAGTKIISGHLDAYNGDLSLALAAYNAGPDAVARYGGVPPYSETQNYIVNVNKYLSEYMSN